MKPNTGKWKFRLHYYQQQQQCHTIVGHEWLEETAWSIRAQIAAPRLSGATTAYCKTPTQIQTHRHTHTYKDINYNPVTHTHKHYNNGANCVGKIYLANKKRQRYACEQLPITGILFQPFPAPKAIPYIHIWLQSPLVFPWMRWYSHVMLCVSAWLNE